jgi:DNA-nicking Smr family endonuclease
VTKITVDLHPIFRSDRDIDRSLRTAIFQASRSAVDLVEIIPGKGSGKLKKRVLAFLAQAQIRRMYSHIETNPDNDGVIYVHFDRHGKR